ncbi:MAG TPA: hypothetical protein ENN79_08775 [Desulfobacteraceae bacterium]|nr:hypothetical protein [Desulfobacteraceae bacterium]
MAGFSTRIPPDSLRYLLVCVLGIIAFVAIAIYPSKVSIANLEEREQQLRYQLERQKSLYPLYLELKKRIEATPEPSLPIPGSEAYPRDKIDLLASAFDPVVEGTEVFLDSVTPDVWALTGDSSLLPVQLVFTGDFIDFQNVLTRLASVPFIAHIGEIRIEQVPAAREMGVKISISIDK